MKNLINIWHRMFFITFIFLMVNSQTLASNDSEKGLIVNGILVYEDEKPAQNQEIFFFAIFYSSDGQSISTQMSIENGKIANPNGVTDSKGNFEIKVPFEFIEKADSNKFSIGILQTFSPGFNMLRNKDGIATTIEVDKNDIEKSKEYSEINVGRIVLKP
jgi:hypothetical protein